ncbi:MAG TPA: hypothetical protein VGE52_02600, partial [Pirellulales bacterium]
TSVSESTSPAGTTPPATGPVETPAGDRSEFTRARMEGLWRVARETRPAQEWRLIAWSDEVIPGMDATPTPQVHREANLFVVHLADEPRPQPQPDTKPRSTVPQEENEALNLEAPMDPNAALPALPGALPVPIPAPQ